MLYPLSYRRRMLTLSKASYALKPRAQFSTYTYLMISARKMKVLGLAISTVLLATGCGSKSPATNSDAWTSQQQNSISKRWLPARSLECQLFINMFQNFNTVLPNARLRGQMPKRRPRLRISSHSQMRRLWLSTKKLRSPRSKI